MFPSEPSHSNADLVWAVSRRKDRDESATLIAEVLGLYEHELNPWLKRVLPRVTRVLNGANDGYFTFGCTAAFQRQGKGGEIIGFEPQEQRLPAAAKASRHRSQPLFGSRSSQCWWAERFVMA